MSEQDNGLGTLRVEVGNTPLRTEHARLLRTALRRGDVTPEEALVDAKIEGSYSKEALDFAARLWKERMHFEHRSATVFSGLLPQLMEAEATLDVKTAVLRMSMDELRHAGICGLLLTMFGETPEHRVPLATASLAVHADCSAKARALRNVMFVGCFSETVAAAMLAEERELTEEKPIQIALDQIAADEIWHAKLGWLYLEDGFREITDEDRDAVGRYLPTAFHVLEREIAGKTHGVEVPDALRDEINALGCSAPQDLNELFYLTAEEVIVPQLEQLGLPAKKSWQARKNLRHAAS